MKRRYPINIELNEIIIDPTQESLESDLIVKDFTELSNTLTKKEDSYAHRN